MAIYKNREVGVIGPNAQATSVETINIRHKDGTHENVRLGEVKFTEDEKKSLQKKHPSKYDDVQTTDDKDLEAVRVGVAPPSDPVVKEQAKTKAQHQKQQELSQKNSEEATKQAHTELNKELKAL